MAKKRGSIANLCPVEYEKDGMNNSVKELRISCHKWKDLRGIIPPASGPPGCLALARNGYFRCKSMSLFFLQYPKMTSASFVLPVSDKSSLSEITPVLSSIPILLQSHDVAENLISPMPSERTTISERQMVSVEKTTPLPNDDLRVYSVEIHQVQKHCISN